jgi:GTP-binding protein HflX
VKDRIAFLKEKLKEIDKQSVTRRQGRDRLVRVAIVGYTNVGKSTLLNELSKSEVFAENKLFATVDSTVRKVVYNTIPFLLTDTVGFIRKLPTHLIESFKSTLDEVREADILVHVLDISHPLFEEQLEVVNKILGEIKAADKPTLYVFNKIDLFDNPEYTARAIAKEQPTPAETIERLKETYMNQTDTFTVFISAQYRQNIDELRKHLTAMVRRKHIAIYPNFLQDEVIYGLNPE